MNLYLRLIWTLLRAWRAPRLAVGDTLTRTLRVWPNDLDVNGHMNNGRYLTVIDLMLVEYFVRIGFASVMLRKGWRPMAGGSFITYRRGLKPVQAYTLRFRLDACDQSWNYMRFEFMDGEKVCAAGYMKGAAVARSGLVPNQQSYAALGQPVYPPALPEPVRHWLAAEQGLIRTAW
ncbi:MAG: thioesterase family protein [Ramlibacter sp.]|jgi:acyl-CoA thioesterase FadM